MKKLRPTRRQKWLTIIIVSVVVLAAVIGGGTWEARRYYERNLEPVSTSQKAIIVTIPKGSTVGQIGTILKQKGIIRNGGVFSQYVRSKNVQDQLQAGTYSLSPSLSVKQITIILTGGNILKNLFTILPGQRIDQVKSAMINAGFDAAEVEQAFNPDLYAGSPALADKPAGASLEGYLYPDSYQKIAETTPQTVIQQSLDEMAKKLTPDIRDGFTAQGLTVHQGITLASIVGQEVSKPTDQPIVAQVFLSRLRAGMMLQSDVATLYGDVLAGRTLSATYDTPYNVFIHQGLPAGPISNVNASALNAVAHPAGTDWLYFVSGDDGKTYFSHTVAEHEALTQQYCKKLCQQ